MSLSNNKANRTLLCAVIRVGHSVKIVRDWIYDFRGEHVRASSSHRCDKLRDLYIVIYRD